MTLLETYNMPFAAALVLMALLAIVQMLGLGDALSVDPDVDLDADSAISAGPIEGLATLLGIGRVPLTIWLALFLLLFSMVGVSLQSFAQAFTGAPFDRWLAAILAAVGAMPVTAALARPLGAIIPKDETSAVRLSSLVGRRAEITDGIARHDSPARARVRDVHGHSHYVMVQPHDADAELHAGEQVLLVRRDEGRFYATALADPRLSPTTID